MPAPSLLPSQPDADLLALERELEEMLVRFEVLDTTWRKAPRALDRWALGKEHDAVLDRIRDLQDTIAQAPARSPTDVAVKLRRLAARIDGSDMLAWQLVTSALKGAEANARDERAPEQPSV